MPKLRKGERMQRCEMEDHSSIRSQKYYICRTYYNELEQHFCAGCLQLLSIRGLVSYQGSNGYIPNNTEVTTLLNIYGEGAKQKV